MLKFTSSTLKIGVYTIVYSRLAVFVTNKVRSLASLVRSDLTARFAHSTGLSALQVIEHYRGRVLDHGRACQRCDLTERQITKRGFNFLNQKTWLYWVVCENIEDPVISP